MENFENKFESKEKEPEIEVKISTREEEMARIEHTLGKIEWLRSSGYYPRRVILPEYYKTIAEKILSGEMKLEDVRGSEEFNRALEYSQEDYAKISEDIGKKLVEKKKDIFASFQRWNKNWGFKAFEKYLVRLTRYGTGGSYDYDDKYGYAITRIGREERDSIFETVIHEFVHTGLEEAIVERYKLKHWQKERIVDLICAKIFNLPGYRIQNADSTELAKLDKYVTKETINDLPKAIEAYLSSAEK